MDRILDMAEAPSPASETTEVLYDNDGIIKKTIEIFSSIKAVAGPANSYDRAGMGWLGSAYSYRLFWFCQFGLVFHYLESG